MELSHFLFGMSKETGKSVHPSCGWRMCAARSLMLNQISALAAVGRLVEQRGGIPMIPHTSCQGKEAIFPRVSAWLGAINTSCLLRTSRSAPPWEYLGNIVGISRESAGGRSHIFDSCLRMMSVIPGLVFSCSGSRHFISFG